MKRVFPPSSLILNLSSSIYPSQLADEQVGEFDDFVVVLQANGAALGNARELSILNNLRVIQHDGHAVAFERDHEAVPLAERSIGDFFGRDGGANFGR